MTSAATATAMLGGAGGGGDGGKGAAMTPGRDTAPPPPATLKDSRLSATSVADGSVGRRSTQSQSPPASSTTATAAASPSLPLAGMMTMAGLMMMPGDAERIRMRSNASNRRRVKDFNDSITCTLCNGYLIEATTINDCLHAFCRSCIVQYLGSHKYCPRCKSYNSKPVTVTSLRPDRTLRALVYKLVPGLHKSEIQRMVQFYNERQPGSGSLAGANDDSVDHLQALLEDQNFYSPDEPISLSLEYHYDTLADCGVVSELEEKKVPITYLQCPAAVTVHHLYKFILTKNGLLVGSDNIRVEIIYEDEILPHDFTLMDVAYCFDYKRVLPMRFFYRIFIHPTTKPAQSAIGSQQQWVEEQDKNSSRSGAGSGSGTTAAAAAAATAANTPSTANATTRNNGQRGGNNPKETGGHGPGKAGTMAATSATSTMDRPREEIANNSSPAGGNKENTVSNGVNGHHKVTTAATASAADSTSSTVVTGINRATPSNQRKPTSPVTGAGRKLSPEVEKKTAIKSNGVGVNGTGGLKMVLVSKPKSPVLPKAEQEKNSSLKVLQPSTTSETAAKLPASYSKASQQTTGASSAKSAPKAKSPDAQRAKGGDDPAPSQLKCYVNLKKQTVVGSTTIAASQSQTKEIPRLKIELPRLKSKGNGGSPSSSSSSSAATSPSSSAASSSTGKSPVWPMAKEEYAKTIGLKPVYAAVPAPIEEASSKRRKERDEPEEVIDALSSSSSHRKRKKGKHSKEAGKRRKLHAEISSQQDTSLKMKVKLTEKPPKHERLRSTGNEEDSPPAINTTTSTGNSSSVSAQVTAAPSKPKTPPTPPMVSVPVPAPTVPEVAKVIDITKDDDDVKFVHEQPPKPTGGTATTGGGISAKDKLSEMRAIRHKPMVYIPNLDRSLSADSASGTAFNSLIESVQAKVTGNRALVAPATTQQQVSSTSTTVSAPSSIASVPLVKPTPALIAAAGLPTSAGAASSLVGKSQPRTPILSPRTMQSYPPLAYPLSNTTTAANTPVSLAGTPASIRTMAAPMKRSISNDASNGRGGSPPQPKLARMEPPSLVSPLVGQSAKKSTPIQAPMFNFAKGANRAKAAQQAAGLMIQQQQQQQQQQLPIEPPPYRSPISSSYTKEIGSKKPIPNLLIPPSSISVTKMSDLGASHASAMVDCRPPVEILRIPPTAPVADKPTLSPFTTPPPVTPPAKSSSGTTPKTTRPPPATIPLIKIKKPTTTTTAAGGESVTSGTLPGMTPLTPGMLQKLAAVRPQPTESSKPAASSGAGGTGNVLDLSGIRQHISDEVIILDHSPVKAGGSIDTIGTKTMMRPDGNRNRKFTSDVMGFSVPSTTPLSTGKTLAPLPKLTEINRNRNLAVRQPNASIRNIPNPSALAFRGAQSGTSMTSGGGAGSGAGGAVSTTSSASAPRPTNGSASAATVTAAHAHSNGNSLNGHSKSANGGGGGGVTATAGSPASVSTTRSPSLNGSHNNNNSKHANANTTPASQTAATTNGATGGATGGAGMKKTIETVAAVLKAAAATADSATTTAGARSPTVTTSTTTTVQNGSNVATTASEPMRKPLAGNTVTSSTTAPVTTNGGNVVRTSSVTSATSASVTSSVSSTNTPNTASIINVG
ncbi:protein suppressor 2 of zeste [Anopheles aquasalis]|uniref:protein suppressor 2 of zeste n=1 Tax=Anopheles aquasalis TaxID=42839 RepID=UPI00215AEDEE|nr:protein suppressor 2 of zeste [Anopheles aquasalis]